MAGTGRSPERRDFEESRRGLIAQPAKRQIVDANGNIIWDMSRYDFLLGGEEFDSIHPAPLASERRKQSASMGGSPVGQRRRLNTTAPSIQRHYSAFIPTTSYSAPVLHIGTLDLPGVGEVLPQVRGERRHSSAARARCRRRKGLHRPNAEGGKRTGGDLRCVPIRGIVGLAYSQAEYLRNCNELRENTNPAPPPFRFVRSCTRGSLRRLSERLSLDRQYRIGNLMEAPSEPRIDLT